MTQGGVERRPDTRPGQPTDADLLAAVRDGDRAALEVLYRRHAPWLTLRLSHRCGDADVVDEALQDTFVTVWRKAGSWTGEGDVGAWIWGVAIRTLMARLRPRAPLTARLAGRRSEPIASAEDLVLTHLQHGELGPALDGLSPELRAVVQATVLDGLTTREAARLLGLPPGTVKTRMRRAREELRAALTSSTPPTLPVPGKALP
ncbi:MAG TPA: RNA polymerase sigma factor [Acidimicrobiales bacterium]|nr:RNA polymerase sigma factor [Acidimicrobiales bacterium]